MRLFFTDGDRVLSIDTVREMYELDDRRHAESTPLIRISPEHLHHILRELDFNCYGEYWQDRTDPDSRTLDDLNAEEIEELKHQYLIETTPDGISYVELARAGELVTMDELRAMYGGVTFTRQDFFCNTSGALL